MPNDMGHVNHHEDSNCMFCIVTWSRVTYQASHGTDKDDGLRSIGAASLLHQRDGCMYRVKRSKYISRDSFFQIFRRNVVKVTRDYDACIANKYVDRCSLMSLTNGR
jgi:hypothetical protein